MELGLIAIGAALAIGLAALATGVAQARIGSAAVGAIAEKPELTGRAILLRIDQRYPVVRPDSTCGCRKPVPPGRMHR